MSSKIALIVHLKDLSAHLLFEGYAVHTMDLNFQFKKNNAMFFFSFISPCVHLQWQLLFLLLPIRRWLVTPIKINRHPRGPSTGF